MNSDNINNRRAHEEQGIIEQDGQKILLLRLGSGLSKVMEFLTLPDKIRLSAVHPVLRQFILELTNHEKIDLTDEHDNFSSLMEWVCKNIRNLSPRSLRISIFRNQEHKVQRILNFLMAGAMESVEHLDLYCESDDIHLASSLCFPNLKSLVLRSQCATDDLVSFMFQNLADVDSLTVIKNDMTFTAKNLSKYLNNRPMKKISLTPYLLNFEQIMKVTEASAESLQQLEIDVQQCENQAIVEIVRPLKKLEKLRLYHLQNLQSDQEILTILQSLNQLSELGLTKSYNFTMQRILHTVKSPNLLTLDITDSRYTTDEDIIGLAKSSPNLKHINLSWCNNINCQGLIGVFQNCLKLEYINLTGVKDARDHIFGQYYTDFLSLFDENKFMEIKRSILSEMEAGKSVIEEVRYPIESFFLELSHQNQKQGTPKKQGEGGQPTQQRGSDKRVSLDGIKILKNVKELDCRNCNSVSDRMLQLFYVINRKARVHNYYGYTMSLYTSDYDSDVF